MLYNYDEYCSNASVAVTKLQYIFYPNKTIIFMIEKKKLGELDWWAEGQITYWQRIESKYT